MTLEENKIALVTRVKCFKENVLDLLHSKTNSLNEDQKLIVKQLDKVGYVVFENFFKKDKCDEIKKNIDEIIKKQKEFVWVDEHLSDHRIFGAENGSDGIMDFYSNDWTRQIGESHLGISLHNHMTLGARLESKAENLGSGGGWHRDSTYEHQFKSIVYLSDVGPENGPFQFISQSHKTTSVLATIGYGVNNNRYSNDEIESLSNKYGWKLETLTGKAGTLILVDTKGLHRGKPIEAGVRYALTNYYIGEYKKSRFDNYFKDLNKLPVVRR